MKACVESLQVTHEEPKFKLNFHSGEFNFKLLKFFANLRRSPGRKWEVLADSNRKNLQPQTAANDANRGNKKILVGIEIF